MHLSQIDIIFILVLFVLLSFPLMYKITDSLTYSIFKIVKNKQPSEIGILLHGIIFILVIYVYFKNKEQFNNICPPGYKLRNPENSIIEPNRSWCELGQKSLEDPDDDDMNDSDEEKKSDLCEVGYTSTNENSYFNDRKSWCRKNA